MTLYLKNISKIYTGEIYAVKDFSAEIEDGVTGFLGPNGAGKSTLMDIITTLSRPTTGTLFWDKEDILKNPYIIRNMLGYLPQQTAFYPELNALDFLEYIGIIKGLTPTDSKKRAEVLLNLVNLWDVRERKLGAYSGGMQRRVGIAQALMNDPKILVIDEPTAGLDPSERTSFRNLLTSLSKNKTILISSHIIPDIEAVANRIIIMRKGQLIENMTISEMIKSIEGKSWFTVCKESELAHIQKKYIVTEMKYVLNGIHARIIADEKPHSKATIAEPSLEDAYHYYVEQK